MKIQCLGSGLALALLTITTIAEDAAVYRVAGIINPEHGEPIAVIELPTGEQQLLYKGNQLGKGKILEIAGQYIRLSFPDGERTWWLQAGKGTFTETPQGAPEAPVILTREVSTQMIQGLKQLAAGTPLGDKSAFSAKLNSLLQLPKEARIRSIDLNPVNSPEKAATMVLDGLAKNAMPHLFISDTPGLNEVYLIPAQKGESE